MNVREALRSADPVHRLRSREPDAPDEALLRSILDSSPSPDPAPTPAAPPRRAWRPLVTTGLVASLVVVATVLAIRAVPTAAPAPAVSPTSTAGVRSSLEAAVDAKLAAAGGEQRLDPTLPAMTWTNDQRGAQGDLVDLTGKTDYLAAACTGGGSVTISIAGQLDTTIDCTTTAVIGPIDLSAIAAKAKRGLGIDVAASEGRPEYVARSVALTGSSVITTPSVEVDGRTLLIYPASGAGGPQALLRGVLTQNAAGCIAVGRTVLVAPSNAELLPDGSIAFGSTVLAPGSTVDLGGATAASIPVGSPCRAATGDYFVVGDYPQTRSG